MRYDRFDICAAYYWYATQYHEGQGSETYKIFGRLAALDYSPELSVQRGELSENAQEIFERLVAS